MAMHDKIIQFEMASLTLPRITFGLIVFNGEPFTVYCLRALYPFAHEIIVVEGACPGAASLASVEGHSTDGTLEVLHRFKEQEDPENKLQIISRSGFWNEKDEQSQAYADRATGDYLWQVDIDEFYKPEDMRRILEMLRDDPEITALSFRQITFWGGFEYTTDGWYLRGGADVYHRLFKWGTGYRYITHRPPTVLDAMGRDLRKIKWIDVKTLAKLGIFLYHYSLVFPKQVSEKCEYVSKRQDAQYPEANVWATQAFYNLRRPYRVHNVYKHPSWLEHFAGTHPPQIDALRHDLKAGSLQIEMRQNDDIETMIDSFWYRSGRIWLKAIFPVFRKWTPIWRGFIYAITNPLRVAAGLKRRARHLLQKSL
jgi:glycosyltransferase involved in cell wall biosynthesis